MPQQQELTRKGEVIWDIDPTPGGRMNVPARIFALESMLGQVLGDRSVWQLKNVASLPGILKNAVVMPDVHEGYGFPIGAVAAIDYNNGVISPGGIGYDINCGVRLLRSDLTYKEAKGRIKNAVRELYKAVPSGVGISGDIILNKEELDKVLNYGCKWAEDEGYTREGDLRFIESGGCMEWADAKAVSDKAKSRGRDQLGTMGSGNHFVEIDYIDKIFDEKAAQAFGLREGQLVVLIHTGSRGLGHQVATDYVKTMLENSKSFGYDLPDRELSCAPLSSDIGRQYFAAMCAAANYAWTNRQLITSQVRDAWREIFGKSSGRLGIVYDVAHNIAKIENHIVDGKKVKAIVHRKGATRAFPAGHPDLPSEYSQVGHPVLIPGSMGTASYVLIGKPEAMELSFGSACHGAGRAMSRSAALGRLDGNSVFKKLEVKGISVQAGSMKGLAEEAPEAYKDIDSVIETVELAGIASKVAKLKPVGVIKG